VSQPLSPTRPVERPGQVSAAPLVSPPSSQPAPPARRAARRALLVAAVSRRRRLARLTRQPAGRRAAGVPPSVAALLARTRAEQAGALDETDLLPAWARLLSVVHGHAAEDGPGGEADPGERAAAPPSELDLVIS